MFLTSKHVLSGSIQTPGQRVGLGFGEGRGHGDVIAMQTSTSILAKTSATAPRKIIYDSLKTYVFSGWKCPKNSLFHFSNRSTAADRAFVIVLNTMALGCYSHENTILDI